MPKESTLRTNCVSLITRRGGWARAVPQGIHSAGMADVHGVYRGVCLIFETKLPGKEHTLTELQAATLEKAKAAGAVSRMVTRTSQVKKILDRIDQIKDKRG